MARSPDLTDLLARWHETAPDECEYAPAEPERGTPARYRFNIFDRLVGGGSDEDRETWHRAISANHDAALVLSAVVYHSAARNLDLLAETEWRPHDHRRDLGVRIGPRRMDSAYCRFGDDVPQGAGATALVALACAALSAYLDAISHE